MKKLNIIPIIILAVLISCKKDPVAPAGSVTDAMARDSLYYIMNDWYYWYNLMPTVVKENYADPYTLLEAMRYKPLDRWSFIADYDQFNAEMQGSFVGHGIRIGVDPQGKARIVSIYNNSPLYPNGVRRGWIIKTINGTNPAPLITSNDMTAYNNLLGPSTTVVTNTFVFTKPDGTDVTITSKKSSFAVNSVLTYDTLHLSSGITGHLVYDSFITIPSSDQLATAFAYFKANNVKDLILDLRYNGGGYLYIAQTLASYIGGNALQGNIFARLTYNDKNQNQNGVFTFQNTSYSLGLSRMVVITTRETASASEAVMNGLKPYLNVVSIGDTTNGKPTGENLFAVGKKYYFVPVTFKTVNSLNQGEYFAGIFPAKVVPDDITHDFSDRQELCLKEAIHYLQFGSVSAKSLEQFKNHPVFSEGRKIMNSTLVIKR